MNKPLKEIINYYYITKQYVDIEKPGKQTMDIILNNIKKHKKSLIINEIYIENEDNVLESIQCINK